MEPEAVNMLRLENLAMFTLVPAAMESIRARPRSTRASRAEACAMPDSMEEISRCPTRTEAEEKRLPAALSARATIWLNVGAAAPEPLSVNPMRTKDLLGIQPAPGCTSTGNVSPPDPNVSDVNVRVAPHSTHCPSVISCCCEGVYACGYIVLDK